MPAPPAEPPSPPPELFQRLPAQATWNDLVLPPDELAQLHEIADRVKLLPRLLADPEAAGALRHAQGTSALFVGASGTGKTLAAEALASDLGLDLWRVDLSAVTNRYIGETEKNLARLFDAAQENGAILLFEDADALFGKRSEVNDSHDRYANLEIAHLLQRLESHSGLVILTSNLPPRLDPAFIRRMTDIVRFPPPDEACRESIWRRVFPASIDFNHLDWRRLARMEITGGTIRDIATRAALRAAAQDTPITMPLILEAAKAELRKLDLTPGVYGEEIPSGVRTITGVATSITAFVGRTATGPLDAPTDVLSFADFDRLYGGLAADCPVSYAVRDFFLNGGGRAVIARIVHRDAAGALDETAPISDADIADPALAAQHRGLWLLDAADLINILCLPPLTHTTDVAPTTWNTAIQYAKQRRAFVIVDPPAAWVSGADAVAGLDQLVLRDPNAALYFPRLLAPDPLNSNLPDSFAPCGAVAGVYALTDAQHGVWKAPAGTAAALTGVTGLTCSLSNVDSDLLNPLAINALRTFPGMGTVVWGARTLAGADDLGSDWKYVPVRRLALFIEESLYRGTQWAVFEPNAEPLWSQLRLTVGTFLHGLFRQGAFQGATPRDAYFVQCDSTTTAPSDISNGVVNILVGFAPLKPAEFIILRIIQRTAAAR